MSYDHWLQTPSDEREINMRHNPPQRFHQCRDCRTTVSEAFIRVAPEQYLCKACWLVYDDRRQDSEDDGA